MTAPPLRLLVADDEPLALQELVSLLRADDRVGELLTASSGSEAMRVLSVEQVDAALLDIHMPGLSGLDLAQALARFQNRPPVVFVTADEERAVDAFDVDAVDFVLKPVRPERLSRAVARLVEAVADRRAGRASTGAGTSEAAPAHSEPPDRIAVTLGTTTRMLRRDAVQYAHAEGDYVRLFTDEGGFLVRVTLGELEEQWAEAGFVRVHRSYLVALHHVNRLQLGGTSPSVSVSAGTVPVSRRLLPGLRARLGTKGMRRT